MGTPRASDRERRPGPLGSWLKALQTPSTVNSIPAAGDRNSQQGPGPHFLKAPFDPSHLSSKAKRFQDAAAGFFQRLQAEVEDTPGPLGIFKGLREALATLKALRGDLSAASALSSQSPQGPLALLLRAGVPNAPGAPGGHPGAGGGLNLHPLHFRGGGVLSGGGGGGAGPGGAGTPGAYQGVPSGPHQQPQRAGLPRQQAAPRAHQHPQSRARQQLRQGGGPLAGPAQAGYPSGVPVNRAGGQWLEAGQKGALGEPVPAARGPRGKGLRGPLNRGTGPRSGAQVSAVGATVADVAVVGSTLVTKTRSHSGPHADVACSPGATWQGQGAGEAADATAGVSPSFRRSNHQHLPAFPRPVSGAPGGRQAGRRGPRQGGCVGGGGKVSPAVEAAAVEIAVLAFGESVEGVLNGGVWTHSIPASPPRGPSHSHSHPHSQASSEARQRQAQALQRALGALQALAQGQERGSVADAVSHVIKDLGARGQPGKALACYLWLTSSLPSPAPAPGANGYTVSSLAGATPGSTSGYAGGKLSGGGASLGGVEGGKLVSTIVSVLGRSGHVDAARRVFDQALDQGLGPNVYAFSALLSAYGRAGRAEEALALFEVMKLEGCRPNLITFNAAIDACTKGGVPLDRAWSLFQQMQDAGIQPDRITYNSLIAACSRAGAWAEALKLFESMKQEPPRPEDSGPPQAYHQYSPAASGRRGSGPNNRNSHSSSNGNGNGSWSSSYSGVNGGSSGGVERDVFTFNSVLHALCKSGKMDAAAAVMAQMPSEGIQPNVVTYSTMMDGFGKTDNLEAAMHMFEEMQAAGINPDRVTYNTLLDIYGKAGRLDDALRVCSTMERAGWTLDVVTFNALISAFGRGGRCGEALQLLERMKRQGVHPNVLTISSLVCCLSRSGQPQRALQLFREYRSKANIQPDVVMYSALIDGHGKHGLIDEAFGILREMLEAGVQPNIVTFNSLIDACARWGGAHALGLPPSYPSSAAAGPFSPFLQPPAPTPQDLAHQQCTAPPSAPHLASLSPPPQHRDPLSGIPAAMGTPEAAVQTPGVSVGPALPFPVGADGSGESEAEALAEAEEGVFSGAGASLASVGAAAMTVLGGMQAAGVQPNVITFSAVVSACSRMSHWQQAWNLLQAVGQLQGRGTHAHSAPQDPVYRVAAALLRGGGSQQAWETPSHTVTPPQLPSVGPSVSGTVLSPGAGAGGLAREGLVSDTLKPGQGTPGAAGLGPEAASMTSRAVLSTSSSASTGSLSSDEAGETARESLGGGTPAARQGVPGGASVVAAGSAAVTGGPHGGSNGIRPAVGTRQAIGAPGGGPACGREAWVEALEVFKSVADLSPATALAFFNAMLDLLWQFGQRGLAVHVVAAARRQGVYGKATWRTTSAPSSNPPLSVSGLATLATVSQAPSPAGGAAATPGVRGEWEGGSGAEDGSELGLGLGLEVEVEGGVDVHLMSVGAALAMLHCWLQGLQALVLQGETLPATLNILTGWGKHSKVRGRSRVKQEIDLQMRCLHSPFRAPPRNEGRLVCSGLEAQHWLLQPSTASLLALADARPL